MAEGVVLVSCSTKEPERSWGGIGGGTRRRTTLATAGNVRRRGTGLAGGS